MLDKGIIAHRRGKVGFMESLTLKWYNEWGQVVMAFVFALTMVEPLQTVRVDSE